LPVVAVAVVAVVNVAVVVVVPFMHAREVGVPLGFGFGKHGFSQHDFQRGTQDLVVLCGGVSFQQDIGGVFFLFLQEIEEWREVWVVAQRGQGVQVHGLGLRERSFRCCVRGWITHPHFFEIVGGLHKQGIEMFGRQRFSCHGWTLCGNETVWRTLKRNFA
jgi:hypothetical protein